MTPEDVLRARFWASDEQIRGLAPAVGLAVPFQEYAIAVDGVHIGYCSIYNVTADEAELGIVIGNKDYWGKGYGTDIVNQLTERCRIPQFEAGVLDKKRPEFKPSGLYMDLFSGDCWLVSRRRHHSLHHSVKGSLDQPFSHAPLVAPGSKHSWDFLSLIGEHKSASPAEVVL